jgi:hypothetical protein
MLNFLRSFFGRFQAFFDKSALLLIIPASVGLYFIDPTMMKTLLQWLIFAPILAGVAIIVSRIVFPQVKLTEFLISAKEGNVAAGMVASSIILFVSVIVIALVMWAKA